MKRECLGRVLTFATLAALLAAAALVEAPPARAAHIDPTVVATVPVGDSPVPIGVNPSTNRVYVAIPRSDNVSVIDGSTNAVIATIPVGSNPQGVGVNAVTNRVYVANFFSGSVSVIDGATDSVVATISVGGTPSGVAVNPISNRVYVTNPRCNCLSVIDGATNSVIAAVPLGNTLPVGVGVNPASDRIYVALAGVDRVAVIDGASNAIVATVPVGHSPQHIGVNPSTNRVYVTNTSSDNVSVIDGVSDAVVATVPVGVIPEGVDVNLLTDHVYVANYGSNSVSSIDGAANAVVAAVRVGFCPISVAVNPATDRVYVSNACDNTVSGIADTATVTLEPAAATNPVGSRHCVTATVRDEFGNPTSGVTVVFNVVGAQATFATPPSGSAPTNSAGQAMFCFTAALPGDNVIHAFADSNNNGVQDAGEPSGAATKTWVLPASTQFCEVTITDGGWIVANNTDRAVFGGNAKVLADGTVQGQQNYRDQGPVQPMIVSSTELTATTCSADRTTASIFGKATIDRAGSHVFRIDVTDMGAGGSNDSYGIMLDTGYMSGQHPLGGGNITIH